MRSIISNILRSILSLSIPNINDILIDVQESYRSMVKLAPDRYVIDYLRVPSASPSLNTKLKGTILLSSVRHLGF